MRKLLLSFLFFSSPLFADHVPEGESFNLKGIHFKTFIKQTNLTHKIFIESIEDYHQEKASKAGYSSSYKISQGHKITTSLFYQSGFRHNDDWIFKSDEWSWEKTSQRFEPVFQLGYKLKTIPSPFIPITLDFHSFLRKNFFNQQESLIIKPGFSYFKLQSGIPKFSIHPSIVYYYPVNFHETKEYKKGYYILSLYHVNASYQIGFKFESLIEQWSTSRDFKKIRNSSYIKEDQTNRILLIINHHF